VTANGTRELPRRDWIGSAVQSIATAAMILLGILAWGQHVESEISEVRTAHAALEARLHGDEAAAGTNAATAAALASKIDAITSQLATIAAQLDDLKRELRR
jgi:signal transduction protein with GAF and PtsI domain